VANDRNVEIHTKIKIIAAINEKAIDFFVNQQGI
jgi:hypothetical protein